MPATVRVPQRCRTQLLTHQPLIVGILCCVAMLYLWYAAGCLYMHVCLMFLFLPICCRLSVLLCYVVLCGHSMPAAIRSHGIPSAAGLLFALSPIAAPHQCNQGGQELGLLTTLQQVEPCSGTSVTHPFPLLCCALCSVCAPACVWHWLVYIKL